MVYNILNKESNDHVLGSLLDAASGKLIITSNNSIVISQILGHLTNKTSLQGIELYRDNEKLNEGTISENKIIICTRPLNGKTSLIHATNDFYIATFVEGRNIAEFDFSAERYVEYVKKDVKVVKSTDSTVNTILNEVKSNNVVIVQGLDEKIYKELASSMTVVKPTGTVPFILNSKILIKGESPISGTWEFEDCVKGILGLLLSGNTVVCDGTWVSFFFQCMQLNFLVGIKLQVVYSTNCRMSEFGNEDLYML